MTPNYPPNVDAVIRPSYERYERSYERAPLIIQPLSPQELNGTRIDRITLSAEALATQQNGPRNAPPNGNQNDVLSSGLNSGSFDDQRTVSYKAKTAINEYLDVANAQRKYR